MEPSLEREGAGGRLKPILTKKGLGLMEDGRACSAKRSGVWGYPPIILNVYLKNKFMKIFKNIPADKIGHFILTVITAFVSTFLMQSCMSF